MSKKFFAESIDSQVEDKGGGTYRIKVIQPGSGSSGIYDADNLAASAYLFSAGTQMFIDHSTETEDWERPERSIRDLAGKFISDAEVGEDGALYADIHVYPSFDEIIREKWEDIGISIHAWSYGNMGPNGEVPPFDGVLSVDFVTKAGAGGAILELLESARFIEGPLDEHKEAEEKFLDEKKFQEFAEATANALTRIEEALTSLVKNEGVEEKKESATLSDLLDISNKIVEAKLPDMARERVVSAIEAGVSVDEAIDREVEYTKAIRESIKVAPENTESAETVRVSAFKKVI